MLVSFIIPAYNAAETLAKAVESLQAQTIGTWEAVIVDDGSTDGTLALARQLAASDARLRVLTQPQGGRSAARNAGLDVAHGEAIAFLDADDWILPRYVERMTAALAAEPELDAVYCGHYCATLDGQRGPDVFPWSSADLFDELSRRNVFAIHTCLVRSSLVRTVGHFDTNLATGEEWDYWQRAARTGARFGPVPEVLSVYLTRPGSATSRARQMLVDGLEVIARGHRADPRVARPAQQYAAGATPAGQAAAKLYYACWAAGLAIGQGQDGTALLALVPDEGQPPLAPRLVAEWLFDAVPWPAGRLQMAWPELWPRVAGNLASFLEALEARSATPGLAREAGATLTGMALGVGAGSAAMRPPAQEPGSRGTVERVAALEQARVWLEQQVANWQAAVAERERQITALKQWIEELEAGKAWLDEQRLSWMSVAQERERELRRRVPLRWPRWLQPETSSPASLAGPTAAKGTAAAAVPQEQREARRPAKAQPPQETGAEQRLPEAQVPAEGPAAPKAGPFAPQRRLSPLSREWGYDRGTPIDRYYIESFLARRAQDVRGRVLEVGDNSYTRRFGGDRVTQSDVLNVLPGHPQTTFVADLAQGEGLPSETFDCVILTQTMQLIYDTRAALRTVTRILKPRGVLLMTCPGLTRTTQAEWAGQWFWRFTPDSLTRLFAEAAPELAAELEAHGNVLAASAFLYGLAMEELTAEELDWHDAEFDVTLAVRAVKPGDRSQTIAADLAGATHSTQPNWRVDGSGEVGGDKPRRPGVGVVLLYHRVAKPEVDPWSIAVSPERFEAQLRVVTQKFAPVRLVELAQAVEQAGAARVPVAVTFDDGYADNLYAGLPALERYGVPATFFVTAGLVPAGDEFWWDALDRVLLRPGRLPSELRLTAGGQLFQWALGEWSTYAEQDWAAHQGWRAWEPPPTPRHAAFAALWQRLHPLPPDVIRAAVAELQAWAGPQVAPVDQRAMTVPELRRLAASSLADFGGHTVWHPSLRSLPLETQRAEIAGVGWRRPSFSRSGPLPILLASRRTTDPRRLRSCGRRALSGAVSTPLAPSCQGWTRCSGRGCTSRTGRQRCLNGT
jgi:peptidoglycan/xylan/chitin deacetylase (PgdA/CDA1 family)/SAM-dependent methyltransferase